MVEMKGKEYKIEEKGKKKEAPRGGTWVPNLQQSLKSNI